jgi:hypothetical protein
LRGRRALFLLLALPLLARAAEVPPELRGLLSVEVTSCEPLRGDAPARAVLLRVRAGASTLRRPEVRCGAFVPGTDQGLGWTQVTGSAAPGRDARGDDAGPRRRGARECRCVAGAAVEAVACAPWEALEDGRCVEPGERAEGAGAAPAARDDVASALRISRALAALRSQLAPGARPKPDAAGLCSAVDPAQISELVSALVPEEASVYVRPPWHRLDDADRGAFATWANQCFGASRIVDAERGLEIEGVAPPPARPASAVEPSTLVRAAGGTKKRICRSDD